MSVQHVKRPFLAKKRNNKAEGSQYTRKHEVNFK